MSDEKVEEIKEKAEGIFNKAKVFVKANWMVFAAGAVGLVIGLILG